MILNTRVKESIKTALAMTIAYGIALSMNWEKAYWAGFAVAFISASTVGQSFNKGAMRMLGTLIAVIFAFIFIGAFSQERWLFMIFLSTYVAFCTYMMGGERIQYFWFVCGFVCVLICMDAGMDSVNAFNTAILRTQETGLGILTYSLVTLLLWPQQSGKELNKTVIQQLSTQRQLLEASLAMNDNITKELVPTEIQQQLVFNRLLDTAESDTDEVRMLQKQWRNFQQHCVELTNAMSLYRESLIDLQTIGIQQVLPCYRDISTELTNRLKQIEEMSSENTLIKPTTNIKIDVDQGKVKSLTHFQQAVVTLTLSRLRQLDKTTLSLFNSMCALKGIDHKTEIVETTSDKANVFVLDPDRMLSVIRIVLIMWVAYLSLIYVESIPGGTGFVTMASVFGMILVTNPKLAVAQLVKPLGASLLFASIIYMFVMPHLTSFLSLGILIFVVTSIICYLFSKPQQAISRAFGLAIFVNIAAISNEQTYSFIAVATTTVMFSTVFLILLISAYFPVSMTPQQQFLKLLRRYFHSCEYLFSHIKNDKQALTPLDNYWQAVHISNLNKISKSLASWLPLVKIKRMSGEPSDEHSQLMVNSLQRLTNRTQLLLNSRAASQSESLMEPLQKDLFDWQTKLTHLFQKLSTEPAENNETLRIKLKSIMAKMEATLEQTLNQNEVSQNTDQFRKNLYSLLGAYRAVSDAVIDYASYTNDIDWAYWNEESFV
jgi:uncharacterized membrane protein YccC